ncbi:hypothetical protein LOAG_02812 [Loa loa]|uniref:Uncharacterized protein n=1 Tax=Loa loa TaxID=7209 RepID=A0A1S0U7N3_LOALO|nr:hypothetical protein LOAG_02812 [Loa loa]EFO25673.1 hypothetical protein LOAG_02812 [Loa loa]
MSRKDEDQILLANESLANKSLALLISAFLTLLTLLISGQKDSINLGYKLYNADIWPNIALAIFQPSCMDTFSRYQKQINILLRKQISGMLNCLETLYKINQLHHLEDSFR